MTNKSIKKLLETPFWPTTLNCDVTYERVHDDHDGTFTGRVSVQFDRMGDAYLFVDKPEGIANYLRFRTMGGGGMSPRVRTALLLLAEAIRLDNEDRPNNPTPTG